jgi:hypothetical protein
VKYAVEAIGTFFLVFTIGAAVGSHSALAPLAIAPSIATATQPDTPGAGTVAPCLITPVVHCRNRHARNAPIACATM